MEMALTALIWCLFTFAFLFLSLFVVCLIWLAHILIYSPRDKGQGGS